MPQLRCSGCKAKGEVGFQIVFVGCSGEAMLGAEGKKHPKATGIFDGDV